MKSTKGILLMIILVVLLINATQIAYAESTTKIIMTSDKQQVNAGDTVSIFIKSTSEINIFGIQFEVDYDKEFLVQQGEISLSNYTAFGSSKTPGKLVYPLIRMEKPLDAGTDIARLDFKALKKGLMEVELKNIKALGVNDNVINENSSFSLIGDVNKSVSGVSINKNEITMYIGTTEQLLAAVTPADAVNKSVIWSSSNNQVVSVDTNGNVKAISPGSAIVTVITSEGGYKATCQINCLVKDSSQTGGGVGGNTNGGITVNTQRALAIATAIKVIDELPDNIAIDDKDAISDARKQVSAAQEFGATEPEITNLSKLVQAEKRITELEKAAAEKAAEKVAAEKVAAEKVAAEKVAAEKVAAEKVAAEKVAAEKAVAEKVAAEKAVAEKVAAEKAAAEKVAAEKAAAEKVAKVKKAAAEEAAKAKKIAAEKAAKVKKAATEKAAKAKKVAAEKAAKVKKAAAEKAAKAVIVAAEKAAKMKKAVAEKAAKAVIVVQRGGLKIYSNSKTNSKILGRLNVGTRINVSYLNGKWYRLNYKGKAGYILKASVK